MEFSENVKYGFLFLLYMLLCHVDAFDMQRILPSTRAERDYFGHSVAIYGERAIVGSEQSGSVYFYDRNVASGSWTQTTKINPTGARSDFGNAVALYDNTAIIGHRYYDTGSIQNCGAAYIFTYNNDSSSWHQTVKLTGNDPVENNHLGISVALQDGTAIIGADTGYTDVKDAYVFSYNNVSTAWTQTIKWTQGGWFGGSVALDGNNIIIGASWTDDSRGCAYVYSAINGSWIYQMRLQASSRRANDYFGASVAISGKYTLIGAWGNDDKGSNVGAVYVFYYNETLAGWEQRQKLHGNPVPTDSAAWFGYSIDIDGQTAIIGARADNGIVSHTGAAYIFNLIDGSWIQTAKIVAYDGKSSDYFGLSVALHGNHAIIGSPRDDVKGSNSGSAYIITSYSDCNAIKTQTVNEQYLINWIWTVCFTAAPSHLTITPTMAPTFAPSKLTTAPTVAPTISPSDSPTLSPTQTTSPSSTPTQSSQPPTSTPTESPTWPT
eukprot:101356_1